MDELEEPLVVSVVRKRMEERLALETSPPAHEAAKDISKRMKKIGSTNELKDLWEEYNSLQKALIESRTLLEDQDPDIRSMVEEEISSLETSLDDIVQHAFPSQLVPEMASNLDSCVIELRQGEGGLESALFTKELLTMYQLYAKSQGWRSEILDESEGTIPGSLRDVCVKFDSEGAYGAFRFEGGVHRVQRVPLTETKGRTHTSVVAVMVTPLTKEEDVEFVVPKSEVREDVLKASGAGGQHVNTTESAVRLVHIPTGITVNMQNERSQHKNRAAAWELLTARLQAIHNKEKRNALMQERQSKFGASGRGDKIRTYNFVQDRVTDHRIGVSLSNLPDLLQGGKRFGEMVAGLKEHNDKLRLEGILELGEDLEDLL